MTCSRCQSRMLPGAPLLYLANSDGGSADTSDTRSRCTSYHCLMCGNYVDPTILANRAQQAKGKLIRPRHQRAVHLQLASVA